MNENRMSAADPENRDPGFTGAEGNGTGRPEGGGGDAGPQEAAASGAGARGTGPDADPVPERREGAGEAEGTGEGEAPQDEPVGPAADDAVRAALEEAEAYRREAEETRQRLLRLQADYDNFRRRTRQEKEEMAKYASQQLVEKLLPVLDNFERALSAAHSAADLDSFAKGVDMIYRQLSDVLAQEGLEPIKAVGEPFDPELHQAVMRVESEEHGDNIIVEELQRGYRLKEKVLRPSMVKVNAKP